MDGIKYVQLSTEYTINNKKEFYDEKYISNYFNGSQEYYIYDVVLPDDAEVVNLGDGKYSSDKYNKINNKNKRSVFSNYECCEKIVKINGKFLQYVNTYFQDHPNYHKLCEFAVKNNGMSLKYVKNPTNDLYNIAVQNNPYAIQFIPHDKQTFDIAKFGKFMYIKNKTEELCKYKVKKDGLELQYVKPELMTDEICKLAVKQNGYALRYVHKQTDEICKLAVKQNGFAVKYVHNLTEEICKLAVRKNGYVLQFIPQDMFNEEICKLAFQSEILYRFGGCDDEDEEEEEYGEDEDDYNPNDDDDHDEGLPEDPDDDVRQEGKYYGCILKYVQNKTYEICKLAVINNGKSLKYVQSKFITEEICKLAVINNGKSLKYVPSELMTDEICKLAVSKNGIALEFVKPELMTDEICKLAVQQYSDALEFVKQEFRTPELLKLINK